ncbi:MAG TPA: ribose-5-phosphate isomerase RpiA [Beijerinckiaceae bacterium]|nr:ribose-5-phosphate isomerase RpiA [Beijerinckiaceae bacterium]
MSTTSTDAQKRQAALRAAEWLRPGLRLGLGTGTTAAHFVDIVGERVRQGLDILCVPTSTATRRQAEQRGIPLTTLDELDELDLTVDGADEFTDDLTVIKGGGGALLYEKIVAAASHRMIVIVDGSKRVGRLGRFPLPVEVVPFGLAATRRHIEEAAAAAGVQGALVLRRQADGHVFVTDGGHQIFDCAFREIGDPPRLAAALSAVPGVVEHGLFIGLVSSIIVAGADGIQIIGASAES